MALQLSLSHQSGNLIASSDSTPPYGINGTRSSSSRRLDFDFGGNSISKYYNGYGYGVVVGKKLRENIAKCQVRASLETTTVDITEAQALVGKVTQVNNDTFWPIVHSAGDKTVVLDMYTQWCGPCKVMAPKFQELAEKNLDVVFLKLDCNQENRPLAKELGIRVVPTFKILKGGKIVDEVTGAKFDKLVAAIEAAQSS